jgi:site-specific recombinase XerC
VPALVAAAGNQARIRFLEFFAADIHNPHTRRAYSRAVGAFLAWCAGAGVPSIAHVAPLHVATWIEAQGRAVSVPSVKQRLAALRHLFDWLVVGHVVQTNPAASVRGPQHIVKGGKTPVLDPAEARALIDSIDTMTPAGLRDRALIALMVYSFARVGAALGMKVEDVFTQNRRLWVRLREKGGKAHAMPCHHNLQEYLTAYIDGLGLRDDPKAPLFRTIPNRGGQLTETPPAPGQCPCDDPPARRRGRHQDACRQPHLPGHRHHGVPEKPARALSVVERLSADPRLHNFRILPLSAAQLIGIDGRITRWDGHGDVRERRRIEIGMRKST